MTETNASNIKYLDLRGKPCPINFVRSILALESLKHHELINIDLDKGEPEAMVIPGLREAGHLVEIIEEDLNTIKILVTRGMI